VVVVAYHQRSSVSVIREKSIPAVQYERVVYHRERVSVSRVDNGPPVAGVCVERAIRNSRVSGIAALIHSAPTVSVEQAVVNLSVRSIEIPPVTGVVMDLRGIQPQ